MKEYWCEKCSQNFKNNFSLKRHNNSIHGKTSGSKTAKKKLTYSCKECGFITSRKDSLKRHAGTRRCKSNRMKMIKKHKSIKGNRNNNGI